MRSTPVFVGSGFVAKYPEGGGTFWVPLQYVLGLRDLGVEAYWLEVLPHSGDEAVDRRRMAAFFAHAERFGIGAQAIILHLEDRDGAAARIVPAPALHGVDLAGAMRHGVLLNLSNSIARPHRERFGRTVLYDIDPGMNQLWSLQWDMGVGSHDLYVTIGQSIGDKLCSVPTLGVAWHRLWPVVHLPSWPMQQAAGGRYTTVSQWWNGNNGYDLIGGELYEHNKRASFLEYVDMPRRSGLELELAGNVTPGETEDRALLEGNGWRLVQPHEVAGDPRRYRAYVQGSRGEFSCAKPSVVKASPGWISDRTICYLASGRPAIVQDAGASRHLPKSVGLQFFSTQEEAAEALRRAERDHDRARREARTIAEEFFSTRVVLPKLVELAAIERPSAWRVRSSVRRTAHGGSASVGGEQEPAVSTATPSAPS